jgi:uncharacterized membrane protein YdbT with pleckstrin-like domain
MDLRPGETALFEGRPAWRALLAFYIWGLVVAVVLGALVAGPIGSTGSGVGLGAAIFVLVLVIGYLRRLFTKYLITNQRLRISIGFIRRHVQETRIERVQNVNFEQGVIDRMLNVGNVDFDTAGTDDSEFRFAWVKDPDHIVHVVDQAHRALEAEQAAAPERPGSEL